MKKTIFYMGAGASCECLPIVRDIPGRLKAVIDIFEDKAFSLGQDHFDVAKDKTQFVIQQELIVDFGWLLEHCSSHASIDTFAKKLWIRGSSKREEYLRLKLVLSIFFIVEQMLNQPDKRYDLFFASILENSAYELPKNIKIVSWNYDYQFELSFFEYSGQRDLSSSQSYLGVNAKYGESNYHNKDKFCIYKLNGTTVLNDGHGFREFRYISNIDSPFTIDVIREFTRNYAVGKYMNNKAKPSLSFAWEKEGNKENVLSFAEASMKEAEILVIIGYSFPFFNRTVDRRLIGAMGNLKKVYIQAPDADDVAERFLATRDNWDGIEIKKVYGVDQFMIPNEL